MSRLIASPPTTQQPTASRFRAPRVMAVAFLALALGVGQAADLRGDPAGPAPGVREPVRRALVVGIDRYSKLASPTSRHASTPENAQEREVPDLAGAVRDARTLAGELEQRGFEVTLLLDELATREGILRALERHLLRDARPGDDLVFYFAGHGSRLGSGDPEEPEGRDETLVPADARAGAEDLLDDELRRILRVALDAGARLTVLLDACHSGSAVRGLPETGRVRAAGPAQPRLKRTRKAPQPPPLEEGDTLILAAARDDQLAIEVRDTEGEWRGAFTYALLRALGSASPGESAATTFRRLESLMITDTTAQRPVLAGALHRLATPLFASQATRALERPRASAVVLAENDDGVFLEGGWSRGLRRGDVLEAAETRVELEEVDPLRSRGRRLTPGPPATAGTLFERVLMGVPREPDLALFAPVAKLDAAALDLLAGEIAARLDRLGIETAAEPWSRAPGTVLRYRESVGWELAPRGAPALVLGPDLEVDALGRILAEDPDSRSPLFVQLPLPNGVQAHLPLGEESRHDAVMRTDDPEEAHYQLVGRVSEHGLVYSWARPGAGDDEGDLPLPPRTRELPFGETTHAYGRSDAEVLGDELTDLALKLARLRFWLRLEGPADSHFPYRLALTRGDRRFSRGLGSMPVLRLGEKYGAALELAPTAETKDDTRYLYLLVIDSRGRAELLFPHPIFGSVENRFPQEEQGFDDPSFLRFGPQPLVRVVEPAGLDTYILLSMNEPIADPWILSQDGVRAPAQGDHPLARLILQSHRGRRSEDATLPTEWSIDRLSVRVEP